MILQHPLLKRVLTALVLMPLLIFAIYSVSALVYAIISGLIMLSAAWEWSRLIGHTQLSWRLAYVIFIGVILGALYVVISQASVDQAFIYRFNFVIASLATLWWLLAFLWITYYAKTQKHLFKLAELKSISIYWLIGALVIVPCWQGVNSIRLFGQGNSLVVYLLFLVWAADSGAYFVGKGLGAAKLCAKVSPGKTIAGAYGGFFAAWIVAGVAAWFLHLNFAQFIHWFILAGVVVIASIIGDLFISVLKRQQGLKDTGHILPGHGGILDRIDSLLAATPVFMLGLLVLGLTGL